jgi:hypothetical protein
VAEADAASHGRDQQQSEDAGANCRTGGDPAEAEKTAFPILLHTIVPGAGTQNTTIRVFIGLLARSLVLSLGAARRG